MKSKSKPKAKGVFSVLLKIVGVAVAVVAAVVSVTYVRAKRQYQQQTTGTS